MKKYPLIGVSICAVVLLVLASLSNVVGYQTVQSSNQNTINTKVNQRELLFQTIVDIVNNKEIQRIILKSQISKAGFFNPDARFSIFDLPVLTQNQLKQMYFIGLILTKVISKSRIHSMVEHYQITPEIQKEISAVIENNPTIKEEITQLQNSECDCENENIAQSTYPIICASLFLIFLFLCIPYGFFAVLFQILHDSLLAILVVPWMILVEIITVPVFILLILFECWDIPIPDVLTIEDIGD